MEILFKHTWVVFMIATIANGLILKNRSKKYISQNPELEKGYRNYFKRWFIYGNIPWTIMMVGDLSGTTQNTFEYFNLKALNPIVLSFHFSIIIFLLLGIKWIYFKKGAEFLENHPGLTRKSSFNGNTNLTAKQIKLFFPLILLGVIIGIIMMSL